MANMERFEYSGIGENLYRGMLPNGAAVAVLTKPGYSKSYAFFATNYGGADRRFQLGGNWIDTPAGVAHFLEHKMFDTADGGNALAVLSANGASPNAYTSSNITAYHFSSTQGFEENLETMLGFVSIPYFTDESVEKEQGIIAQEINMIEDNPGFVVYKNLLRCLYRYNPVRDSVAGSVESIAEISAQTLYDCHRVFYNPSNMILCVAGDVDPELVYDIALRVLPTEPGELPVRDYGEAEPELPEQTRVSTAMEVSAPLFILGTRIEPEKGGDALLRQKLVGTLALQCLVGNSSPFYTRLYAEGLINENFDSGADFTAGTAMLMIEGESTAPDQVLEELKRELAKVAADGLDSELFERQKRALYGARLRGLGAFEGQCRSMADGYFGGYCHLDAFDFINDIAQGEVTDYIVRNLAPEKLAMSIVTPK